MQTVHRTERRRRMTNIENIFICMAAPLIIATVATKGRGRRMLIFMIAGMTSCLLSSYISTFIAVVQGVDLFTASLEISPLAEEILKFCPALFFILVFEPDKSGTADACVMIAIGFATFENVCFIIMNGADNLINLTIRGLGTGAMHVVCGSIIAFGLLHLWDRLWLRAAGTVALLCVAVTYHGVFNVLVSQTGIPMIIGFMIPLVTTAGLSLLGRRIDSMEIA